MPATHGGKTGETIHTVSDFHSAFFIDVSRHLSALLFRLMARTGPDSAKDSVIRCSVEAGLEVGASVSSLNGLSHFRLIFVLFSVSVYARMRTCVRGDQRVTFKNQFSPSINWVPAIELRS